MAYLSLHRNVLRRNTRWLMASLQRGDAERRRYAETHFGFAVHSGFTNWAFLGLNHAVYAALRSTMGPKIGPGILRAVAEMVVLGGFVAAFAVAAPGDFRG
jgi:hypothetical protein